MIKGKEGGGGGGGGLLTFFPKKGELIREGGLIEDLQYCSFHWDTLSLFQAFR